MKKVKGAGPTINSQRQVKTMPQNSQQAFRQRQGFKSEITGQGRERV